MPDPLLHGTNLTLEAFKALFQDAKNDPFRIATIDAAKCAELREFLVIPMRRCYITDANVLSRATATGLTRTEILASKLPDRGATMAGDFGEILAYLFHQANELPKFLIGPKKWRLKQDRKKPAPHSDVIHFYLPEWPNATSDDELLCSEVKLKSTSSGSSPISSSILGCENDRTGRLGKTLAWLKERAIGEELEDVSILQIDRFLKAVNFPLCQKRYFAIAVICESLCETEVLNDPPKIDASFTFLTIKIPELHKFYNEVFELIGRSMELDDAVNSGGLV